MCALILVRSYCAHIALVLCAHFVSGEQDSVQLEPLRIEGQHLLVTDEERGFPFEELPFAGIVGCVAN